MPFGQLVIGPPGSGKTTYCNATQQYLCAAGRRVALLNLDPANDGLPYEPDIDVRDLVCLEQVMAELGLGPNGGLVYCVDYLEQNLDWLFEKLLPLEEEGAYLVVDCPGQVELFTQHGALRRVLDALSQDRGWRLAAVHLVDSHLCTDPPKYVAALLLSLSAMLHLELPHVNILSKVDLLRSYGGLDFGLEFYTEVQDLSYLVRAMGRGRFGAKHRRLTAGLCELVQDFGLVSFLPLAIEDKASLQAALHQADRASGALYASLAVPGSGPPPELLYGAAHRAEDDDIVTSMQERYLGAPGRGGREGHVGDGGEARAGRVAERELPDCQEERRAEAAGSSGGDDGGDGGGSDGSSNSGGSRSGNGGGGDGSIGGQSQWAPEPARWASTPSEGTGSRPRSLDAGAHAPGPGPQRQLQGGGTAASEAE